ncbi:putative Phytocyanin domain, cupredoxin [Arabidopsis thaliana]
MALIKNNIFFTSLLIFVTLFGVAVGGTVHKVGNTKGWTMIGGDYEAWASSRVFQVGDTLVFAYNKDYHDVTETGSDSISLTKPGLQHFICGVPGHCKKGQKLQIHVLPASLGHVAVPVPGPVRSQSSSSSPSPSPLVDSPVNNAPQYQMGPTPASHSAASADFIFTFSFDLTLIDLCTFFILFFILV